MKWSGFYDINSVGDDFQAQAAMGATLAWVYVHPAILDTSVARILRAGDAGLKVIINPQGIIWDTDRWVIRPNAVADWATMDRRFTQAGAWPHIVASYNADEPFHNATGVGRDKRAMATDLRLVNYMMEVYRPDLLRLGIFAWVELLFSDPHPSAMPERVALDSWGFDCVGFSHYSEDDGSPHCDDAESYGRFFNLLRSACPNAKKALVLDGAMFEHDVCSTHESKLRRNDWILQHLAAPDVIAALTYCWSARTRHLHNNYTAVKENLFLGEYYGSRLPQLLDLA